MAGRGREATLPAWQTAGIGSGVSVPLQQGQQLRGGAPGAMPGGQGNWRMQQAGMPGPPNQAPNQPWGRPQQPVGPQAGMHRMPYGPGQSFSGPPRPVVPLGPQSARPELYGGPPQQMQAFQQPGPRPMGGLPQPPPGASQMQYRGGPGSMQIARGPGLGPGQAASAALGPPAMQALTAQAPLAQQPAALSRPPTQGALPSPPKKQPAKSAWTEHTAPDGRKYYYNASTKTSSWTKPVELSQPKADAPPAKQEVQCDWKEFLAPDGRKYYYNRVTKQSKWQMPEELKQAQAAAAASKAAAKTGSAGVQVLKLPDAPSRSPANGFAGTTLKQEARPAVKSEREDIRLELNSSLPEPKKPLVYATKEEAKEAFKELLASVGTASTASWESTMRLIVNDPRYQAFKTIGEKKACFNEYLQQRTKEEKEEARARAKQTRDDFFTLLELSPELKAGTRYSKASVLFEDEPRWKAIKDPREREQLFNEHMRERDRKEKDQRKAELKSKKAAFRSLLETNKSIKVDSTWRKAQVKLEGEDEYEALEKLDRLDVFQSYIRELEKQEKERRDREKEERRREERKNRDLFKALLKDHAADGIILPKMRWKEYYAIVEKEDALKAAEANVSGSRPKELFEDFLEEVEDEYIKSRTKLKDAKLMEITVDTGLVEFDTAVEVHSDGKLASIPKLHRKLYFEEEVGKAKERAAKEEKRKRRAREDFRHLLRDTRRIKHDSTWADAKSLLEKEPEYKALDSVEREELFNEFVEKLKAKREKDKEKEREREKEKEKEKEREKEKEEKKARVSEEDKPKKDKKRHKKERHLEKEKGSEKKSKDKDKDKERHGSKRRHEDSDDEEEKKASKRHKEKKDKGKSKDRKEGGGSSPTTSTPPAADRTNEDGSEGQEEPKASPKRRKKAGSSDAEDGQL